MATKKPTIEELAAQVQESAENVRRAVAARRSALAELRHRLCVAAGAGNHEKGRAFLLNLLAGDWQDKPW